MSWIELAATIFGLICVWLTIRQNIWCWPVGLVQVGLYVYVFYHAKLYSDMILHVIYVVMQIYGWVHWLRGGPKNDTLPISRLRTNGTVACLLIGMVGTTAVGWGMGRYTDAALPYWDAAIMLLSLIAQFLLARKVLENWIIWISVDVLAIGVYAVKQLYVTTGLYSVFLVLAMTGWFAWRRSYQQQTRVPSEADADLSSANSCPLTGDTSS